MPGQYLNLRHDNFLLYASQFIIQVVGYHPTLLGHWKCGQMYRKQSAKIKLLDSLRALLMATSVIDINSTQYTWPLGIIKTTLNGECFKEKSCNL
jgi:hypothetical protein